MIYVPVGTGYWMGKTEVSVKQYLKFVNEKKSNHPEWLESGSRFNVKTGSDSYYKGFVEENLLPIVGISWKDANAYCRYMLLVGLISKLFLSVLLNSY